VAAAIGLVAGGVRHRRRLRRLPMMVAPRSFREEAKLKSDAMLAETLSTATPVPEDFQDAMTLACNCVLLAMAQGKLRQQVFYDSGDTDMKVNGAFGTALGFVDGFGNRMAEELKGKGSIVCVFGDMGKMGIAKKQLGELPAEMRLEYFPPMNPRTQMNQGIQEQFDSIRSSDLILVVAPEPEEICPLMHLCDELDKSRSGAPVVLLNSRLTEKLRMEEANIAMKKYLQMKQTMVVAFHLQQYDPPQNEEEFMNAAVIVKAHPKPYTIWEDNPDDPEAIDGFFLMDVSAAPPKMDKVKEMLKSSKTMYKVLSSGAAPLSKDIPLDRTPGTEWFKMPQFPWQ